MAAIPSNETVSILPNDSKLVPTGISIELPPGFEAQVRPRSGLALKSLYYCSQLAWYY